jgi:diacylglycerol kinase
MDLRKKRKIKIKSKKIINSFKYAIEGFCSSFKTERNMKIHVSIMILVIIVGILLEINKYEWIICIICFAIVISGELFNTAIETITDMVMPYKNEKAKLVKDISAGGVLILAIGATIIGLIIFVPKISLLLGG